MSLDLPSSQSFGPMSYDENFKIAATSQLEQRHDSWSWATGITRKPSSRCFVSWGCAYVTREFPACRLEAKMSRASGPPYVPRPPPGQQ